MSAHDTPRLARPPQTKQRKWRKPAGFGDPPGTPNARNPDPVAEGTEFWERATAKGRPYFVHTQTKATLWQLPRGGVVVARPSRKKRVRSALRAAAAFGDKSAGKSAAAAVEANKPSEATAVEGDASGGVSDGVAAAGADRDAGAADEAAAQAKDGAAP